MELKIERYEMLLDSDPNDEYEFVIIKELDTGVRWRVWGDGKFEFWSVLDDIWVNWNQQFHDDPHKYDAIIELAEDTFGRGIL